MFTPKRLFLALLALVILLGLMAFTTGSAQASACTQWHVVKRGQNLFRIGLYYNVSWKYLADINNIRNPRKIYTGQRICVSTKGYHYSPPKQTYKHPTYTSAYQYPQKDWSITVVNVVRDESVAIRTSNFPDNVLFAVLIGGSEYNKRKWIQVDELDSGAGGSFKAVFPIPGPFYGESKLAIKLVQAKKGTTNQLPFSNRTGWSSGSSYTVNVKQPYYKKGQYQDGYCKDGYQKDGYCKDGFYKDGYCKDGYQKDGYCKDGYYKEGYCKDGYQKDGYCKDEYYKDGYCKDGYQKDGYCKDGYYKDGYCKDGYQKDKYCKGSYYGIPTISIMGVVRNQNVTIKTHNFPPNKKFDVRMGPMGTKGKGGYHIGTIYSGKGGTLTETFPIPASLRGSYQISIRTQDYPSGYYSYNWFYNNTTR